MTHAVHASLTAHPDNPPGSVRRVGVTLLQKPDGSLTLAYAIYGPGSFMRIPSAENPAPADALWRTTCCELFIGTGDPAGAGYREFNFSPSGQWAAYDFSDYRVRSTAPPRLPAPRIRSNYHENRLRLDATLPAGALPTGACLPCAFAVIVEAHDGQLGYWALAHPAGRPDFHHRSGFTLCLDTSASP